MALKSPFASEYVSHQLGMGAAGFSVGTVVGSHDSLHPGLLYAGLKGGKVCFMQLFFGNLCIKIVALFLRSGVYRKMLGAGRGL